MEWRVDWIRDDNGNIKVKGLWYLIIDRQIVGRCFIVSDRVYVAKEDDEEIPKYSSGLIDPKMIAKIATQEELLKAINVLTCSPILKKRSRNSSLKRFHRRSYY